MRYPFLETAFEHPFTQTDLPLHGKHQGKVRDIYTLADENLLLITTDRLSAFDRILGAAPYKGQVLNQLAAWWFEQTKDVIANPLISLPDPNVVIMKQAQPFSIEVVVRGFITGVTTTALWYRYSLGERDIYGYTFPEGLRKNQALLEPIITPTTKGEGGAHDERLTCAEVVENGHLDSQTWAQVQTAALAIFKRGQEIAKEADLILVDTKYEFGRLPDGTVVLIDEVHTPDSSRFWLGNSYQTRFETGEEPENYDKEFIRLEYARQGYRGEGDPPVMPKDLWLSVGERYVNLYERLTGLSFEPGNYPVEQRLTANLSSAGIK